MGDTSIVNGGQKGKKLLERAWDALLDAGVDLENARRLVAWMKEYILFHDRRQLQICDGKGDQGRVTVLPERLVEPLRRQMESVRRLSTRNFKNRPG